jgi:aspartyl-tRNA(Asn)/glutamyl-tRNA(Gln) amidotransferase subunit C
VEESVKKVARLARLHLSEDDLKKAQKKFEAILEHFEFLKEANTEGVQPLYHAAEQMELRPDQPEAPLPSADVLRNAPDEFENCFRLPKVVGTVES